jgi:hypothetical protein
MVEAVAWRLQKQYTKSTAVRTATVGGCIYSSATSNQKVQRSNPPCVNFDRSFLHIPSYLPSLVVAEQPSPLNSQNLKACQHGLSASHASAVRLCTPSLGFSGALACFVG